MMRLTKFIVAATAAWALWSMPVGVAVAHSHHGNTAAHGTSAKSEASAKKDSSHAPNKAKQAVSDCCKPAVKSESKPSKTTAKGDCCASTAKSHHSCSDQAACSGACKSGAKAACSGACKSGDKAACSGACKSGDKAACAGACKSGAKAACAGACKSGAKAACSGACKSGAKAACSGACGEKSQKSCCSACCRKQKGWKKHLGNHKSVKSASIRFLPALGGATNQHIIFSSEKNMALNSHFSLGGQFNHAFQVGQTGTPGPWYVPYAGFLPKVGLDVGPVRADVGALLGGGAMFRTTQAGGVNNLLEARLLWAVEPRLDLGMKFGRGSFGLTAGYLVTAHQADFGGPTLGLRWSYKGGH